MDSIIGFSYSEIRMKTDSCSILFENGSTWTMEGKRAKIWFSGFENLRCILYLYLKIVTFCTFERTYIVNKNNFLDLIFSKCQNSHMHVNFSSGRNQKTENFCLMTRRKVVDFSLKSEKILLRLQIINRLQILIIQFQERSFN